jgi:hypothetical protein
VLVRFIIRGYKGVLFLFFMKHQGIEYTVLQTANPSGWKWSFEREGRLPKTGIAYDRIEAVRAAELAINRNLKERRYSK